MSLFAVISAASGCVIVLYAFLKRKLPQFLLSALAGAAAFFAADYLSSFFSFTLPLNAFTLAVSAVGGVPGVILLNLLFAFL